MSIFVYRRSVFMIIYSPAISHRLSYMADFIGRQLTGLPALITDKQDEFITADTIRLNYSSERVTPDEIWVSPHTLLFEKGISPQVTDCFEWKGLRAFFKRAGDIPFDILAAAFYLLSRYEEYLPHRKDMYGRYAHENSVAYREGFHDKPLINLWLQHFSRALQEKFSSFNPRTSGFTFLPTYDIDEAWSFKYKHWKRSAGAAVRDILRGRFRHFRLRRSVLNGNEPDPFDSYNWLDNLHRPFRSGNHTVHPRYFFLVAAQNSRFDKNILPGQTALQTLIRRHTEKYHTGVHPSWQSGDNPALIKAEKETIEQITKTKITASRQHYIRFTIPETYRRLTDAGIHEEFSMGYGSINGFRASVASPFYWYDLEKEQTTSLLVYPFCYMEANSFFEQKYSPLQALDEMYYYYNEVKKVNGTLITIWHNTFLGTAELFEGWREVYAQFFNEVAGQAGPARHH